jgi:hypothetical protein
MHKYQVSVTPWDQSDKHGRDYYDAILCDTELAETSGDAQALVLGKFFEKNPNRSRNLNDYVISVNRVD